MANDELREIFNETMESVISEWQNKLPLQVVGYEQNQGLAHALNFGLQFLDIYS